MIDYSSALNEVTECRNFFLDVANDPYFVSVDTFDTDNRTELAKFDLKICPVIPTWVLWKKIKYFTQTFLFRRSGLML